MNPTAKTQKSRRRAGTGLIYDAKILAKVWKLLLLFIFMAYTLHSHQQVPEARRASGFPFRGKQEGSTKTGRDPSSRVGGRSVGGLLLRGAVSLLR